jgi:hypothetical protein
MKRLYFPCLVFLSTLIMGLSACTPSVKVVYEEVTVEVVITATGGDEDSDEEIGLDNVEEEKLNQFIASDTPGQFSTNTIVLKTETPIPPTLAPIPPTESPIPPTFTPIPPTETSIPPTFTPIPPTETSEIPKTPKILLLSSDSDNSINSFSKLQGLALENGIKIENNGNPEAFSGVIAYTGWGGWNASRTYLGAATLLDIDTFVRKGGRAIIFVTPISSDDFKSTLGDLYTLTLASELIIWDESIVIEGGDLFSLWEGLSIGSADNAYETYIANYIAGNTSEGKTTTIFSDETGEVRTSSIIIQVGEGFLALVLSPCTYGGGNLCRIEGAFFSDFQIDRLDNMEAAESLLYWLAER